MPLIFLPLGIGLSVIFIVYNRKRPDFILRFFNEYTSGKKYVSKNKPKPTDNSGRWIPTRKEDQPLFENANDIKITHGRRVFTLILIFLLFGIFLSLNKGYDYIKTKFFAKVQDSVSADSSAKSNDSLVKNGNVTTPDTNTANVTQTHIQPVPTKLSGIWYGENDSNYVSLVIEEIDTTTVKGYSCINGKFSAISGEISSSTVTGCDLDLKLKDPNDDNKNGMFSFSYDSTKQVLAGYWESYDKAKVLPINLSPATKGKYVKVLADTAYLYDEPEYHSKTEGFLEKENTMTFDSLNRWFIHCTYHIQDEEKSGWFLITKVAFL